MIFGKTYKQKYDEHQKWLTARYDKWIKKFAWLPTRMNYGQYVWLQYYYYQLCIYRQNSYNDVLESSDTHKIRTKLICPPKDAEVFGEDV